MARRRTVSPALRPGRRGKRSIGSGTATMEESAAVFNERAAAAEEAGVAATKASDAVKRLWAGSRFARWARIHSLDLPALTTPLRNGYRQLPAAVVLTYLQEIARPGVVTDAAFRGAERELAHALREARVVVPGITDDTAPAVTNAVDGLASQLAAPDRRPARPVIAEELLVLDAAIVATVADPVWREALRAFQTLAFTYGGRIVETLILGWGAHQHDDEESWLDWPPAKYQELSVRLRRSRSVIAHPALDPVARLDALRAALAAAGHEPGDGTAIFPLVDDDGTVTLDPIESLLHDPAFAAGEPPLARRGRAERRIAQRYRHAWTVIATGVLEGPTGHRRISPYGFRRALMAALVLAGHSELTIMHEMRHERFVTSMRYLDGRVLPVIDAYQLLEDIDLGNLPTVGQETIDRLAALDFDDTALVEDADASHNGALPELDWVCTAPLPGGGVCGRSRTGDVWSHLTAAGEWVVHCGDHLAALLEHRPDWIDAVSCEAAHDWGDPAAYGPLSRVELPDGSSWVVCKSHRTRRDRALAAGTWRDGRWREPLQRPIAPGTPCAGECTHTHRATSPLRRVVVDGTPLVLCQSHGRRADAGEQDWSRPLMTSKARSHPRAIDPAEVCAARDCGRSRSAGYKMRRVPGIGVLCATGHYTRWKRSPESWDAPLREVTQRGR